MAGEQHRVDSFDIMVKQLVLVFMGLLALVLVFIIIGAVGDKYYTTLSVDRQTELEKQEAFARGMSYEDYLRAVEQEQSGGILGPAAEVNEKTVADATASAPKDIAKQTTQQQTPPQETARQQAAQPDAKAEAASAAAEDTDELYPLTPDGPLVAKGQMILPAPNLDVTPAEIEEMSGKAAVIYTTIGSIVVELYPDKAPKAVKNFMYLVKNGFYNGLFFHRVYPGICIEAGSPNGVRGGTAGYWYVMEDDSKPPVIGAVGFLPGDNSAMVSSELVFYVNDGKGFDSETSQFGRIIDRFDVAEKIARASVDRYGYFEDRVYIMKVEIVDRASVAPKTDIWATDTAAPQAQ